MAPPHRRDLVNRVELRIGIICDVGNRKIIRKECPNQHEESEGQTCEGNA